MFLGLLGRSRSFYDELLMSFIIGNIFNPYYTTREEGEGSGIGLYISKMIIEERMNGRIEVQKNSQGTEFKIIVPTLSTE